jgi:hypothetical protein
MAKKEKSMKVQTHRCHVMVIFAVAVFSVILTNLVWGANYTAIDLTPSGSSSGSYGLGISGSQQVGYVGNRNAMLWNGSAASYVDLMPSGFDSSVANGTNGIQQIGYGSPIEGHNHALLWSGSADSYVDLNPSGFSSSCGLGIYGTQQVGYGYSASNRYHALLWNGSASSYVDLHPNGFYSSFALGIYGTQQVGYGNGSATGYKNHALLWSGTAASYIDLHPSSGFDWSTAEGISGTQQVGWGGIGDTDVYNHALLWSGSALSCVDLNPSGFAMSEARATNGIQQVGIVYYDSVLYGHSHAFLWNGSADSYIDLHQFLPAGYTDSQAFGIDNFGNVIGVAIDSSGSNHAILWQIPEPATLLLLCLGAAVAVRKQTRSKATTPLRKSQII